MMVFSLVRCAECHGFSVVISSDHSYVLLAYLLHVLQQWIGIFGISSSATKISTGQTKTLSPTPHHIASQSM